MKFFFVSDYKNRYVFFSTEPPSPLNVKSSRLRKFVDEAKKRFMAISPRILRQEQALRRIPDDKEKSVTIICAERLRKKRTKLRFRFFLRKKKSAHIFFLVAEALALPLTGLAGLLPGPNVFFGLNILLMITHWQGLRGINRLLKKKYKFIYSGLISRWEEAVKCKKEADFTFLIKKIEEEYGLPNIQKVLWK
ncbi:MAG: hypothetical protein ACE5LC_00900 [Candidatus Aminicenantales bacterium]